jgi:glycosyltransferase involved in cell wall biosynthesis
MRTLIAIPVYNEANYVASVLTKVLAVTRDVLVVDDGSTDGTPAILAGFRQIHQIRHPVNRGYGQSLIDAFAYAHCRRFDWIITIDCDDQHEPGQIPEFIERASRDDVDIVSGSRYLSEMPGNTVAPQDRRFINYQITRMLNEQLGMNLTDAFCGFKAYRVSSMATLSLSESGYAFPLQFWVQAVRKRLRICELAVPLIYVDPSRAFGGVLDDPAARLQHYLEVYRNELEKSDDPDELEASGCGVLRSED